MTEYDKPRTYDVSKIKAQYYYTKIFGKKYQRITKDGFWYPCNAKGSIFCDCGSDTFLITYDGPYETVARCTECDKQEIVHSG